MGASHGSGEKTLQPAGLGALTRCPACGGALGAVNDGETTNFLCRDCSTCWHVELGFVSRVNPMSCPGCPNLELCRDHWRDQPDWRVKDRRDDRHTV